MPTGEKALFASQAKRIRRRLAAHPHRTAAGLLGLLVLVYLWPVLLGGGSLVPTAVLMEVAPWHAVVGHGFERYVNYELGDVTVSYYPWDVLARHAIHAGTFPAWNPHAFAGTPLFANFEIAWLSPFSLPLWVLPLNYGLGVAAALKLWIAGFGTYLFIRSLRLGFWPAMAAAVSYTLCAFSVVWLTFGVFGSIAALLPWGLWLVERIVREGGSADALWLTIVIALAGVGGHPGTALHVLTAVALYAGARTALVRRRTRAERVRGLLLVGAAFAVGSLVAAVVVLPAQKASVDTLGALIRRDGAAGLPGTHMPFGAIRTALFPEWWGRPSEHLSGGASRFRERTFYAGVVPLILAVVALASPGAWRRKAPFALMGALGLAIPLHAPLLYPLVIHLPLFDQVQNQRLLLWFLFAVAVLSAFGLDGVLAARAPRRTWAVTGGALLVGLVVAATLLDGKTFTRALGYMVHRTDDALPATLALTTVLWWIVFALGLAAVLLLLRRRWLRIAGAGTLVVLLVAVDLLHFGHGYNPMGSASAMVPPRTPAIAYLQRHGGDGRIAGIGTALPDDWSTVYGLSDIRGYDAPQPPLRLARIFAALDPGGQPSIVTRLSQSTVRLMSLLGGRYAVAEPDAGSEASGLSPVYRGPDATVFFNQAALPRAFVPRSVEAVETDDAGIAAVANPGFDLRSQAVVPAADVSGALPGGATGTAGAVAEDDAGVTLQTRLRRRGLVVLDDQYMPGWTVTVDGRPARALRTDVVLRGVVVPAGSHRVVWRYRVPGLRAGAAMSATGVLIALVWAGVLLLRRRRPPLRV